MKTTPRPHDVERLPVDRNVDVEPFFDTLKQAQSRFLDVVGQAQSSLGRETGQLAHVAAIQGRLTRQFFDAQRSIMLCRAEVDAEVAHIGAVAAENAAAVVAAARVQAAAGDVRALEVAPCDDAVRADLDVVHRSARQEIASLGVAVVRTMAEADSLASVIDDAFEPDEPDHAAAERQLTALLDEWWRAENQEGRAVIDDADARAAVRLHVARIEAGEVIEAARAPGDFTEPIAMHDKRSPLLPLQMVAALETADPRNLHALLAALDDTLAPAPTEAALPEIRPVDDMVINLDRAPRVSEIAPEEAFRRFWDRATAPSVSRSSWGWIPRRVVLPMTAVTSVLALFMALIG